MLDLLNTDLRPRDLRRIIEPKLHLVVWDPGIDPDNEWIVASTESDGHTERLIAWLKSKNVPDVSSALRFNSSWSQAEKIIFGKVLAEPATYFGNESFLLVGSKLDWVLAYMRVGVARFGSWPPSKPAREMPA